MLHCMKRKKTHLGSERLKQEKEASQPACERASEDGTPREDERSGKRGRTPGLGQSRMRRGLGVSGKGRRRDPSI